ncbi:MAG TPA: arylamine N-acetyltransferase [Polyangiaceae bacterium]
MHQVSVDRYCARIGYRGPLRATLDTLNAIIYAHVQTIPFENLDVLLGRAISLDLAAIEQKLLEHGRGGYCFEHNTLLLSVLAQLGFEVTPISARVRIGRARDEIPSRTHVFLRIDHEQGTWLADVGVGGLSPTSALRLVADTEQQTPHELRRILREGAWSEFSMRAPDARLLHQAKLLDQWHDVYEFTLEPMPAIDRELGNWFTSAHPNSHFRSKLMVARATPTGRVTLLNRELTIRSLHGDTETVCIDSPDQLLEILERHFELVFPRGTRFQCQALNWPNDIGQPLRP